MAGFLKRPKAFDGFGPSILAAPTRGRLQSHEIPPERLDARKMLRSECPIEPGVYGWLDPNGQLIYVGKSKTLRRRLLTYFAKTPSDRKMLRIRQHSHQLVWEPVSHELLALIREQELIYRWRPEFNSQGQPTRMQPAFICLGKGAAPNAFLARRLSAKAGRSYGPISGTNRLRDAALSLNMAFRLRDCADKTGFRFNDQRTLFEDPVPAGCIRFELNSCDGPCAGFCSSATYQQNVNRAIDFLEGRDRSILSELESRMHAAAAISAFERAAMLRDYRDSLVWLDRRLSALRIAEQQLNGVLQIETRSNKTAWLVLKAGRIVLSGSMPRSAERAAAAAAKLTRISRQRRQLPSNLLEMNLQLIVTSWLQKNPQLKKQLMRFSRAIEYCQNRIENPARLSA